MAIPNYSRAILKRPLSLTYIHPSILIYMRTIFFFCSLINLSAMAQNGIPNHKYPQTKKGNQEDVFFGTAVKDPYRWLEDDRSDSTALWVKDQNKVTDEYL